MTEIHTPLIVGNGGYAHGAEFEIRTADASDRYVTGIPWADVNAPESGTMLTYGEAHDMAHRIVQAVNSHHRLVEALEDCVAVLTDPIVGTIYHDDPDWYQALDRAVTKARAALKEAGHG